MAALALAPPMMGAAPPAPPGGLGISLGGVMSAQSPRQMADEQRRTAELAQSQPLIQGLAAHVRKCWSQARDAKEQTIEQRMLSALRARRGEYDPHIKAQITAQGGSEIYMMLIANKCRGASGWLRDVMMGSGVDKPWTLKPTPMPTLPPATMEEMRQAAIQQVAMVVQATGKPMPPTQLRKLLAELREEYLYALNEEARAKMRSMEVQMEDQLLEGGYVQALDQFLDDIVTFPAAFVKGPVVRNKGKLNWLQTGEGQYELEVTEDLKLEWERVDPFHIYPSAASIGIDDGYLIERHKLRSLDLEELIGVEGYDDEMIKKAIEDYGRGGLIEWLSVDTQKADAEGRSQSAVQQNTEGMIDALQYWGHVSGEMLADWGLPEEEVPEKSKQYACEVWLIGSYVIKASLNYHPLGLKPYFKASYEDVPGAFWGNGIYDLIRDCGDMCNSAARALANNMAIASGPQVVINVDRVPEGYTLQTLVPWQIHQATSDPMGSTAKPVDFFQPVSNSQELMAIYEKFSILADEYSGVPRYMMGGSPTGGAGRTASGMSMLMNNANKSIKQVVSNIDRMLQGMLERLYFHNMLYSDDPELKGDAQVIARGANSVLAKESAQVRRNEFLAATANPIDLQIMGIEGRASLLRETAKDLSSINPDDIVPPRQKFQIAQQVAQMMAGGMQGGAQTAIANGAPEQGGPGPSPAGQNLQGGAPQTDNFSQPRVQ